MKKISVLMILIISFCLFLLFKSQSISIENDDAIDSSFEVDSEEIKDAWSPEDRLKSTLTLDDFSKMTTKELKKKLALKGQNCKGCAEKADFVKLAFESQDVPDITVEPIPPPHEKLGDKDKNMDDIMEKLRQSGFNGKFFNKNDMAGMQPDDMEKMFRSKPPRGDRKKEKKSKADNSEGKSSGYDKKSEAEGGMDSSSTSTSSSSRSPDSSASGSEDSSSSGSKKGSDKTNDSELKENGATNEKEGKSKESSDAKSTQKDKPKDKPKDKSKPKEKPKDKPKEKPREKPKEKPKENPKEKHREKPRDSPVEEDIDNIEL